MSERGYTRAAEQVFRTRELMPSGSVSELESMVKITFSTFSGTKDRDQQQLCMIWKDGYQE